jgi:hypothetical protein
VAKDCNIIIKNISVAIAGIFENFSSVHDFILASIQYKLVARDNLLAWGTVLQTVRSRVQFLIMPLNFSNLRNSSSCTMAMGSTLPQTEMSTRKVPGVRMPAERKADNLTAIC